MSRKDYPFSRRDVNSGTKLVSGILGNILAIPFSGLSSSSDFIVSSEHITPTIRKLYDSEIETEEIELLEGYHLEVVRGENWKTSGFVLTNPIGLKKTFLMGKYLDVQKLQMHDRANILRSITRDINDELYIVEAKRILS